MYLQNFKTSCFIRCFSLFSKWNYVSLLIVSEKSQLWNFKIQNYCDEPVLLMVKPLIRDFELKFIVSYYTSSKIYIKKTCDTRQVKSLSRGQYGPLLPKKKNISSISGLTSLCTKRSSKANALKQALFKRLCVKTDVFKVFI